jgi:hypothetical protein
MYTETVFIEKLCVWDPLPELTLTSSYVEARVDSNTFTMGIGQPYARVDLNPIKDMGTMQQCTQYTYICGVIILSVYI